MRFKELVDEELLDFPKLPLHTLVNRKEMRAIETLIVDSGLKFGHGKARDEVTPHMMIIDDGTYNTLRLPMNSLHTMLEKRGTMTSMDELGLEFACTEEGEPGALNIQENTIEYPDDLRLLSRSFVEGFMLHITRAVTNSWKEKLLETQKGITQLVNEEEIMREHHRTESPQTVYRGMPRRESQTGGLFSNAQEEGSTQRDIAIMDWCPLCILTRSMTQMAWCPS